MKRKSPMLKRIVARKRKMSLMTMHMSLNKAKKKKKKIKKIIISIIKKKNPNNLTNKKKQKSNFKSTKTKWLTMKTA
jgi:hypothetical protein